MCFKCDSNDDGELDPFELRNCTKIPARQNDATEPKTGAVLASISDGVEDYAIADNNWTTTKGTYLNEKLQPEVRSSI